MVFFEIIAILSLCLAGISTYVALYAIKANLHQAKQIQQIYQALSAIQIYYYEEDFHEDFHEDSPPIPAGTDYKVIDLFTRMPIPDEED